MFGRCLDSSKTKIMKKLLLLLLFAPVFTFGQDIEYCNVVARVSGYSQTSISFDTQSPLPESLTQKDERGKPIKNRSIIEALNLLANDGWRFENSYVVVGGGTQIHYYTMSRKKPTVKPEKN